MGYQRRIAKGVSAAGQAMGRSSVSAVQGVQQLQQGVFAEVEAGSTYLSEWMASQGAELDGLTGDIPAWGVGDWIFDDEGSDSEIGLRRQPLEAEAADDGFGATKLGAQLEEGQLTVGAKQGFEVGGAKVEVGQQVGTDGVFGGSLGIEGPGGYGGKLGGAVDVDDRADLEGMGGEVGLTLPMFSVGLSGAGTSSTADVIPTDSGKFEVRWASGVGGSAGLGAGSEFASSGELKGSGSGAVTGSRVFNSLEEAERFKEEIGRMDRLQTGVGMELVSELEPGEKIRAIA